MALTIQGKQALVKKLQAKLRDSAARLSAFAIDAILEHTPKEIPGRMQAAWLGALQKLDVHNVDTQQYTAPIIQKRTPEAAEDWDLSWSHNDAEVFDQSLKVTVKLLNSLLFASTVEFGGKIEVGAEGRTGPKISKSFPGQLDSPRYLVPSGAGMLRWIDESGQEHLTRSRDMPGSHSISRATSAIRFHAKKLGFT